MSLISRAFGNASGEKIVYIYVRQITTIGIEKDQLKRILANSIDYIGEGT